MARQELVVELVDTLIGCYADRLDVKVMSSTYGLQASTLLHSDLMSSWEWERVKRALKLEDDEKVLEYIAKHPSVQHITRYHPWAKLVIEYESTYPRIRFQQASKIP